MCKLSTGGNLYDFSLDENNLIALLSPAKKDIHTDVLVIGGGITGIFVRLYAKAGRNPLCTGRVRTNLSENQRAHNR